MENDYAVAMIIREPQIDCHSIIIVKRHVELLKELTPKESKGVFELIENVVDHIDKTLNKQTLTMLNSPSGRSQKHIHFQLFPLEKGMGNRDLVSTQYKIPVYPETTKEQLIKMANTLK
jgi:diadenosine tetraphosphate (Ap4A) HIT family hydrolase